MSDYRPESEVRRLGARPGETVRVSGELFTVVARAIDLWRLSRGAFDATVGPFTELWRTSRRTGRLPGRAELDSAALRVGSEKVHLDSAARTVRLDVPGMRLDLGGIAKGYILDHTLAELGRHGVRRALLEAGGDTEQFVLIEGVRYSHVIDPHTGLGLTTRRQATVVAEDGVTADGLATALVVLDAERGAALLRAFPQVVAEVRRVP
jgi:FAD:protein FMN transferase